MIWQVVDAVDDELSRSTKLQDYANSLAFSPCCCCSVAHLCPTFCSPMNCSTPGIPILHYLWEFAQTHVHRVSDAIQPSHPVSPFFSCPQSFSASRSSPLGFQNFSYLLSSRSYVVKFHHLFSKFFKAICKVLLICSIFDSFQGLLHLKQTNKKIQYIYNWIVFQYWTSLVA